MTAKVIVETHTSPVRVSTSSSHSTSTPTHESYGHTQSAVLQEAHSVKEYVVHDRASVLVEELPLGTTSLLDKPKEAPLLQSTHLLA